MMGVLIGLLTLIIVIGGGLGFFELRRLQEIRNEAKKDAEKVKRLSEEVRPIVAAMRKHKQEAEKLVKEIRDLPLTEKPPEEIKEKLERQAERSKLFAEVGMALGAADYFNIGVDSYFKGKYDLAVRAFEQAIELKPD